VTGERDTGSARREWRSAESPQDGSARIDQPRLRVERGGKQLPVLEERRRGTKFVELPVRSVINSPESTGMGFWSINPYVGCEFGCSYCYARYAHRYVVERARDSGRITQLEFRDLQSPHGLEPFEHRIFVKSRQTFLQALERDLPRVRKRTASDGPQSVVIGTATDPYQPAERQYQLTRATLARLRAERGMRVGVITKSPLVCRDIDLLKHLARNHWLTVYVSLTCVDTHVIKRFEARSPMPHARLRALSELVRGGIRAGLIVAPILPGITDTVEQIERLMRAARDMGARFVAPIPLRLYPDVRRRFLPLVEQHFPQLGRRYHAAYRDTWDAPEAYSEAVRRRYARLARKYGIAASDTEREQHAARRPRATQLSLFENWPGKVAEGAERC